MWFLLSVITAFLSSTATATLKVVLKDNDEFLIGWLRYFMILPILAAMLFLSSRPNLSSEFWRCIAILLPLEICAYFLFLKSIKISDLSLTFPFLGLTPLFSILTGWLILGERLTPVGVVGIILVSLGAYSMNINLLGQGILAPIKNIYHDRGSFLMVIVAFIFSITSTLGKKAVMLSTPYYFPILYYTLLTIFFTLIVCSISGKGIRKIHIKRRHWPAFIISAFAFMGTLFVHFKAISLVEAAYMISVKRLSLLFSVIYGAVIFKEKNIRNRILGVILMILGVGVLAFCR